MGSGDWFKTIISKKKSKRAKSKHAKLAGQAPNGGSQTNQKLNGPSSSSDHEDNAALEEWAATRIQNAFRKYKARKTLRCLRGVKRLRVVGQANPVKKQTAATLSYIQSWNKLQSEIRNRRAFMVTEGRNRKKKQENQMKLEAKLHNLQVEWNGGSDTMDEILARIQQREEAAVKRERAMAYAFNHQWRAKSATSLGNFSYEVGKNGWGWSWMDRWIAARPWEPRSLVQPENPKKVQAKKENSSTNPSALKLQGSISLSNNVNWSNLEEPTWKNQLERHENALLKQENDKLRAENLSIRGAMRDPICSGCGGPALLEDMSLEEHRLRLENARLRDELTRVCALTAKFLGRPISPMALPLVQQPHPLPGSSLDLAVVCVGSMPASTMPVSTISDKRMASPPASRLAPTANEPGSAAASESLPTASAIHPPQPQIPVDQAPGSLPNPPVSPPKQLHALTSTAAPPSGPHDQPSPAAAPAPATTPAPTSPLSPSAAPFYPIAGRGKALRWADGSPSSSKSSPPVDVATYRDALLRVSPPRVHAPPPAPAPAPPRRPVHDRLGPLVQPGRRPARRRGRTELVHGLPPRGREDNRRRGRPPARNRADGARPDRAGNPHRDRSGRSRVGGTPSSTASPSPPAVDEDGFTTVFSKRSRRRRRQRLAQGRRNAGVHTLPPAATAPRRLPEQEGRCFNCLSAGHLLWQCKLPTRCFRCRGLWHVAKDCKRPRSTAASSGSKGHRRVLRARRQSLPPMPPGPEGQSDLLGVAAGGIAGRSAQTPTSAAMGASGASLDASGSGASSAGATASTAEASPTAGQALLQGNGPITDDLSSSGAAHASRADGTPPTPPRPDVGKALVVEFEPFHSQCPHRVVPDVIWVDPMRFECAVRISHTHLKVHTEAPRLTHAAPAPLVTYKRRPKLARVESEPPRMTPPLTPLRLDFGPSEETNPPDASPCWTVAPRRRTPQSQSNMDQDDLSPARSPSRRVETPSTAAAMAATTAFLASITLTVQSPLLSNVPVEARIVRPPAPTPAPRRSNRLASDPLNLTVRPSMKGEVLAMKKLGFLGTEAKNDATIEAAGKEYRRFFTETMDVSNFPALRDLLPAARVLTDDELMAAVRQAGEIAVEM